MSQEITVTNNKLLIKEGACYIEAERTKDEIVLTIKDADGNNYFALDADSAHILSIFLKHT